MAPLIAAALIAAGTQMVSSMAANEMKRKKNVSGAIKKQGEEQVGAMQGISNDMAKALTRKQQ